MTVAIPNRPMLINWTGTSPIIINDKPFSTTPTEYADIDVHEIISDIGKLSQNPTLNTIPIAKNITTKAIRIVNGIYDYSLIRDLDYSANAHGTISLELEKELDGREIYLHIEIGKTTINWQFRVNGNRLDQEEDIVYKLEDFCDITYSFPDEVKRGILLFKKNYQA